jgi:hypothetical protein
MLGFISQFIDNVREREQAFIDVASFRVVLVVRL